MNFENIGNQRKQEHTQMNVNLFLKMCIDDGAQPRERLLNDFKMSNRTDTSALAIRDIVLKMPDYNLEDVKDFEKAKDYLLYIFQKKEMLEDKNTRDQETEMTRNWVQAGIFAYEITGDGETGDQLIIHVPPTGQPPKLGQIRSSLKQIARFLEFNPEIVEISGSSLLLQHSLAKRLGFDIKRDEHGLSFRMSRDEFIGKFKM